MAKKSVWKIPSGERYNFSDQLSKEERKHAKFIEDCLTFSIILMIIGILFTVAFLPQPIEGEEKFRAIFLGVGVGCIFFNLVAITLFYFGRRMKIGLKNM